MFIINIRYLGLIWKQEMPVGIAINARGPYWYSKTLVQMVLPVRMLQLIQVFL